MSLTHNQIVKSMQVGTHLLALYGLYYVIQTGEWSWLWLSLGLWYFFYGPIGLDVGFHRLISHRSFTTYRWLEVALAWLGTLTAVGSPLAWSAIHRQHHRYSDVDGDPHSPIRIGNFRAWVGLWEKPRISTRICRDLMNDKVMVFLHNNYFKIHLAFAAILFAINPLYVLFVYAIPVALCFHSCAAIIVVTHHHGYVTHNLPDASKNSWIAHLMTCGEGWHNNHHADSRKWNTQEKWWEIDPPAMFIRLIKKD